MPCCRSRRSHELNRIATGGLVPDLTLLLDVDAAWGLAQATVAGADRLEQAGADFHERVRAGYLELAEAEPGRVRLIGRASVDEVAARGLGAGRSRCSGASIGRDRRD